MTCTQRHIEVDALIGGAGVTGAAAAWTAAAYSNLRNIAIIEKYGEPGMVNSHPRNNAQTLHEGNTETNYSLEHALEIRDMAGLIGGYCRMKNDPELFQVRPRMALGVTREEVAKLERRYAEFKPHYPDLELIYRDEIEKREPKIVEGRRPGAPLCALVSRKGDIVNYQKLAKHLLEDAQKLNPELQIHFNTEIRTVRKVSEGYIVETNNGLVFHARTLVFDTGAYSLHFAQMLGYGQKYGILSVRGSFFDAGTQVQSKVYRVQVEGKPFAEIHMDPDILDMNISRCGPTTLPVPLMESRHWETCPDYLQMFFRSPWATLHGFYSLARILSDWWLLKYVFKHGFYELPVIGPWLFLREVRPIIPTIRYKDLKYRKDAGGLRPQIINLETGELLMGNVTIKGDKEKGDHFIAVSTPSPGASASMGNGEDIVETLVDRLGPGYHFDKERFRKELLNYRNQ